MKVYVVIEDWSDGWNGPDARCWSFIRSIFKEEKDAVDYCLYGCKTMHDDVGVDEIPAQILYTNQESLEAFYVALTPVSDNYYHAPESILKTEVHELQ